MRQEMVAVREAPAGLRGLADVAAYLDAAPAQEGVADGLVVTVGIANRGRSAVPLLNPFDLVQFQLLDGHGNPLQIPTRPSSLRRDAPGRREWTFVPPLPIVGVTRNGDAAGPEAVGERVLTIGPGEEYGVAFLIARLLRESPSDADAGGQRAEVPLPDGDYRVRCIATLIHADQPRDSRILQSPAIAIRFARRSSVESREDDRR